MNFREWRKGKYSARAVVMDESLAEHDAKYHPNGFDPEKDECKLREKLATEGKRDDLGDKEDTTEESKYEEAVKSPNANERTTLLAPNGKQSNLTNAQYHLVRTKKFKEWFGDWENDPSKASKVVDENGEPLVVYHGTDEEFTEFDESFTGSKFDYVDSDHNFFFTDSYARASGYGEIVMPVFLKVVDPEVYQIPTTEGTDREKWEDVINAHDLGYAANEWIVNNTDGKHDGSFWWKYYVDEAQIQKDDQLKAINREMGRINKERMSLVNLNYKSREYAVANNVEMNGILAELKQAHQDKDEFENGILQKILARKIHELNESDVTAERKRLDDDIARLEEAKNNKRNEILRNSQDAETDAKLTKLVAAESELSEKYKRRYAEVKKSITRKVDKNGSLYNCDKPSQIKSADPVTYDDAGNVIPLSKRFDSKSKDIRF